MSDRTSCSIAGDEVGDRARLGFRLGPGELARLACERAVAPFEQAGEQTEGTAAVGSRPRLGLAREPKRELELTDRRPGRPTAAEQADRLVAAARPTPAAASTAARISSRRASVAGAIRYDGGGGEASTWNGGRTGVRSAAVTRLPIRSDGQAVLARSTRPSEAVTSAVTRGSASDVAVGGDLAEPALRSLHYGGRFVTVGYASGVVPRIPLNLVLLKGMQILGFQFGDFAAHAPDELARNEAELLDLLAAGDVRPPRRDVRPRRRRRRAAPRRRRPGDRQGDPRRRTAGDVSASD